MTDQRKLELVSAAIDCELDVDERAELNLLLEASQEARDLKAEFENLDSLLHSIEDVEPPESLHAEIMAQAHIISQPVQSKPSIRNWLRPLVPGAGIRYALAAAAGALVVAIIFNGQPVLSGTSDFTDLVGTMAPDSASVDAGVIDSFAFANEEVQSLVQLRRSDGLLLLMVQVDASTPLEIGVDLSGAGYQPKAVAQLDSEFDSIAIAGQNLQMRAVGAQEMSVLLSRVDDAVAAGGATIKLEFSSEGRLLQRGALAATLEGARR